MHVTSFAASRFLQSGIANFNCSNSEQQLADVCGGPLPPSPPLAILSSPALETVVPYLLKPAQISTSLGIGGKGDMEKAINRVAAIRYDALTILHRKLKQFANMHGAEPAWSDIVVQMEKRLAQGRWGGVSGGTCFHSSPLILVLYILTFGIL